MFFVGTRKRDNQLYRFLQISNQITVMEFISVTISNKIYASSTSIISRFGLYLDISHEILIRAFYFSCFHLCHFFIGKALHFFSCDLELKSITFIFLFVFLFAFFFFILSSLVFLSFSNSIHFQIFT
ncbi:hypothetical protein HanIR_Chr04g0154951 [Helianthus annuus]|nr:hypothetical protein HanIR_Chr04g0154951 [Helianthus annuus]